MPLNLYHISQTNHRDYDTYDSAVVAAETERDARYMHPDGQTVFKDDVLWYRTWANPKAVTVKLIGIADEAITSPQVIVASCNAG